MKKYQRFIFESYELNADTRVISLRYSLDDKVHFEETFTLPENMPLDAGHPDLDRALFALHLSGGASYYKTYCPKIIEIRSGKLNETQAEFWNQLYTHGLGEFFYRNQIDFRGLINFPVSPGAPATPVTKADNSAPGRALVPFGGGKDSIVSTEILRAAGINQTLFRVRGHKIIDDLAGIAGLDLIEVQRTLAPELITLAGSGAYQGHIPITAHLSFLAVVVSLLAGFDSVFFSSERSSSYGNVEYLGMQVNHQWSKSLEFEQALRAYIGESITANVRQLNVIRPLSELHIAKLFTAHPQYFHHATSCNRNWVLTDRDPDAPLWCCECPKCAFSFALLASFLPAKQVEGIFGHNMFDNPKLLTLYRELWGSEGFKPFECVGTPEETQAALYLASKKRGFKNSIIMNEFEENVLPGIKDPESLVTELLTPQLKLAPVVVREILSAQNRRMKITDLTDKKVCILGYGREGRATYAALKHFAPLARISIADSNPALPDRPDCPLISGPDYLKRLDGFDVIIKSPGVKWHPTGQAGSKVTSATELFLNSLPTGALTIGVTGTKGKSTTAHLIHQTLKAGGRHAILAGNIGIPMLGLLTEATDDTVFVLELSSYMLESLHTSPNIAVLTSFFPDHVDYHGTIGAYLEAKKNITRYQAASDTVFYNADYPQCQEIASLSAGDQVPFKAKDFPGQRDDSGQGNLSNFAAAYLVATKCGISEQTAKHALENAEYLPHRQQSLGTHHGIVWVNDSAATTPQSTISALERLAENVDTIIVGGLNRDYDFADLGSKLANSTISHIVLFPTTGALIRKAIENAHSGQPKHYLETSNMDEAVAYAYKHTRPGRVCLLSSGSPSYNLYKDYPERGEDFRRAISELVS